MFICVFTSSIAEPFSLLPAAGIIYQLYIITVYLNLSKTKTLLIHVTSKHKGFFGYQCFDFQRLPDFQIS